jgi:hypothetical protein
MLGPAHVNGFYISPLAPSRFSTLPPVNDGNGAGGLSKCSNALWLFCNDPHRSRCRAASGGGDRDFQRWGERWLNDLPPGADLRQQDLYALGPRAIGGRGGVDLTQSPGFHERDGGAANHGKRSKSVGSP